MTLSSQGCSQPSRSNSRDTTPAVKPHSGTPEPISNAGPRQPDGCSTLNRLAGSSRRRMGWWMIAPTSSALTGISGLGSRQ